MKKKVPNNIFIKLKVTLRPSPMVSREEVHACVRKNFRHLALFGIIKCFNEDEGMMIITRATSGTPIRVTYKNYKFTHVVIECSDTIRLYVYDIYKDQMIEEPVKICNNQMDTLIEDIWQVLFCA